MRRLRYQDRHLVLYYAGLPGFKKNFTRDSIISAIILRDPNMLRNQLIFCAKRQGKKQDPITGEEPGKIHHEIPGHIIDGLSTKYNACDTTAFFLIGMKRYLDWTDDTSFVEGKKENITLAMNYIKNHNEDGFFIEDPVFSGADRYALRVTYWKDAPFIGNDSMMPAFPVIYPLAHIQNMVALREMNKFLQDPEMRHISEKMQDRLPEMFHKSLFAAIDRNGPVDVVNSDVLHALFYLEKEDLNDRMLQVIDESSRILETRAGFLTLDPNFKLPRYFRGYNYPRTVWPFEQALIHIGCSKFGLKRMMSIAGRVNKYLKSSPEYLLVEDKVSNGGCDPQLWTLAAKEYFSRNLH